MALGALLAVPLAVQLLYGAGQLCKLVLLLRGKYMMPEDLTWPPDLVS